MYLQMLIDLNINSFFIISVISALSYRLITGIYLFIKSGNELSIFQRLFRFILALLDLEIFQTIKVNYKMNCNHLCVPQRIIHFFQICFEIAPFAIIQISFLWQIQQIFEFCLIIIFFFFFAFFIIFFFMRRFETNNTNLKTKQKKNETKHYKFMARFVMDHLCL